MYEECDRRALGHDWVWIPATESPAFGVALWRRCTRCATVRKVALNRFTGDQLSSYYDYPENWSERFSTFDGKKPTPDEFRLYTLGMYEDRIEKTTKGKGKAT